MYKILEANNYQKLMDKYNLSSLAAKVMCATNIELTAKIISKDSYNYKGMNEVVSFILKAMSDKRKIAIYGDYDVDGICAVSILYRTFQLMNYEVGYYVPNRYEDGYGLSSKIVKQMKDKGYSLIICVDNGIKAFEAIKEARTYNMDVIVLDHHTRDETLPNFNLFLHPEYSSFSEYNMCGASICYYVSTALLGEEDEKCLSLAGIATIGDVMPLIDQNKLIVSKAISYLNKFKFKAIDLLNSNKNKYDENIISMQIVPKLNSIGRMCKNNTVNKVVKYLTTDNEKELFEIASLIENTNKNRKETTDSYFKILDKNEYSNKIIVEKNDEMIEGINGIIAARFVSKYNLPTIIFSLDESKEYYKGSARSINDCNIIELLNRVGCLEAYGGHKGAAGLTLKKENYDLFKNQVIELTNENIYKEEILKVIEIEESELSYKAYLDLLKLSPFGEGNPSPLFVIKGINADRIKKSKDGKHILINFNNDSSLIGFNLVNELKSDIINYDVIFKIEANNLYSNKISCKCIKMEESLVCMNK